MREYDAAVTRSGGGWSCGRRWRWGGGGGRKRVPGVSGSYDQLWASRTKSGHEYKLYHRDSFLKS